jgi:hypothetical protein
MQALGQNIRAHSILQRKKEKVSRKYTQPARQRRQLSPGFLEDALDEVGFLSFLLFLPLKVIDTISYCCSYCYSISDK